MDFNELLAPSGQTFKHKQMPVGEHVQGLIQGTPKIVPDNDFVTKQQKVSQKGNPLWQVRINLKTAEGDKTIYLDKGAYFDFINEVKTLGIRTFEECDGLAMRLKRIEDTPSKTAGFAPAKNFEVKLKKA